ncbi:E3 ubiquitin- ligase RNF14 [Brachionus plicatilis]|uniref:RBR-type E3 ubiquitin transferase n=1 Tax=Brachionus plicatilis TaxID=10195 RepID=A0A3M7Q8P6_BRAPC|nr:E3 ubiquitin- ligase RNF14 [Brachionus plicatilis]
MDDQSIQDDEILALKSIYEEEDILVFDEKTRSGKFIVKISSDEATVFQLNFPEENVQIQLLHLTPIILEFYFPDNYPSVYAPQFKLICRWLSEDYLTKICNKLDELWEQNSQIPILFTWISFLQDEIFDFLSLEPTNLTIQTTKAKKTDPRVSSLACTSALLTDYDSDQKNLKFQKSYFTCYVCFEDKMGKECIKFNKCEHVFCNECMRGYFGSLIKDGNVHKLTCPQEGCESQAIPAQVLSLVGIEMYNRYDSMLLRDALNNMTDIVYCPRASCQCAVIPEDATLCRCPDCKNVFCALCRQAYHGIEPCKLTNNQLKEIVEMYKNGDEEIRLQLAQKYGEKRMKKAVEDFSSVSLIETTSKKCPKCTSWLQKIDGCNKMTCFKCQCYFCWLCMNMLSKTDPYSHFNDSRSKCFEKLFEGVEQNEDDEFEIVPDNFD